MPDGKTHAIMTVATSFGMFSATNYLGTPIDVSLSFMCGGLVGLILTPDLDQSESRRSLWGLLWWPYGKAISHRDIWSHFPILSTIIRIIYLFSVPLFVLWWYFPIENWIHWDWIIYGILGLMASDTIHFLADMITTKIKRTF
jgi:uncharacterized metal-binding protein